MNDDAYAGDPFRILGDALDAMATAGNPPALEKVILDYAKRHLDLDPCPNCGCCPDIMGDFCNMCDWVKDS